MPIEFRLLESSVEDGLGIPYRSRQGANGIMEYFDLKRSPSLIPKIRELRNHRELQEFVSDVNRKESLFKTLRCEMLHSCPSGMPTITHKVHWHFTFCFEIVDQNYKNSFDAFNSALYRYSQSLAESNHLLFELKLIPTSYRDHDITLWSEDIEIFGYGRTKPESKKQFKRGLRMLQHFMGRETKRYAGELNKGRPTISSY